MQLGLWSAWLLFVGLRIGFPLCTPGQLATLKVGRLDEGRQPCLSATCYSGVFLGVFFQQRMAGRHEVALIHVGRHQLVLWLPGWIVFVRSFWIWHVARGWSACLLDGCFSCPLFSQLVALSHSAVQRP